jgi:hypothetical protein
VLVGAARQPDELPCRLELLIRRAQALEFEPQQRTCLLSQVTGRRVARSWTDGASHQRQGPANRVREDCPERLAGVRAREPAGRIAGGLEDVAEKLLKFVPVRHLEQPRGELELLRLGHRQLGLALCGLAELTESGLELPSFQLHPIDVVHRHLRGEPCRMRITASAMPTTET